MAPAGIDEMFDHVTCQKLVYGVAIKRQRHVLAMVEISHQVDTGQLF